MVGNWRKHSDVHRLQIFVHDLGASGVVRNAIAVANEAAACGYQVRLLTCNADGILRRQLRSNVAVVKLNDAGDARLSRRKQMQKALLAYRRHSRDWEGDIMMSAGNHGHLLSTIAWLGLPGSKVLRFSNALSHDSPLPLVRLWRAAKFRFMARLADRLVYVSRAQDRHPLLSSLLAAGKAKVIPNGVDFRVVRSGAQMGCDHPWAGDSSIPIILAVGRHVKQKNFAALLTAFARARTARPMRLMFLGDGKPEELGRLMKLAAELGVKPDVAFVPAVANPFPYMAAASTFVLPSLWEGSANVLLEAMACGTPVIASRTAGDAEQVLASGQYGMLVDPWNIDEFATALLQQTGPHAIMPGKRPSCFARDKALRAYVQMFDSLVAERGERCGITMGDSAVVGA